MAGSIRQTEECKHMQVHTYACMHTGQSCCSIKYIYVYVQIHDDVCKLKKFAGVKCLKMHKVRKREVTKVREDERGGSKVMIKRNEKTEVDVMVG